MPRSILFVFVFALVSCHATPPAPPKASWAEVIQKLRQCLDEFPKRAPDGFISPCAYSDVSSLNGINRNELITAFGGVPACYSHKPMPKDITTRLGGPLLCEIDDDPFWTFFEQPMVVSGNEGWPFLVCEAEGTASCVRVVWKKSL